MGDFDYNAPQFIDFTSAEALDLSEYGDEYFDMDHEVKVEEQFIPLEMESPESPEQVNPLEIINLEDSENDYPKLRRSISAGQLMVNYNTKPDEASGLSLTLNALHLSEEQDTNKFRNAITGTMNVLPSKCNFSGSKFKSNLNRPKAVSRDAINKTGVLNGQLKRKISVESLKSNKYISIAEAINKFQFDTPQRFHSQPSKSQFKNIKTGALMCTVPQSPLLSTKQRIRTAICVSKKEPGNLVTTPTCLRKEALPKFQEMSKGSGPLKVVEIQHDGVPANCHKSGINPTRTIPVPFSFEERDKLKQRRKEEKIKKFLEDEKKAREFHARPISAKITGGSGQIKSKVAQLIHDGFGSNNSINKSDENTEPNQNLFKARPATVIHKKPFIPKKEDRPLIEITKFNLNADKRVKEREQFEKKIKEKEMEYTKRKQELAEMQKQRELEEINKLRKDTVHKANPVKHYRPVEIHPSTKKITSPITPSVIKRRNSHRDH